MNLSRSIPKRLRRLRRAVAFTLVELLVVMAIIGVLAAIGLPALKGMGGSNDIAAATRQLMDDLSYARIKAINERSTVYVVFVSPAILEPNWPAEQKKEIAKLAKLQFTSYALFTRRSLGDQPGPGTPRYITEWKTLPEGIIIPTNKFDFVKGRDSVLRQAEPLITRPFYFGEESSPAAKANMIPFPNATNDPLSLPYIAFDFQGRLKQPPNLALPHDVIVPIAKGSVVYPQEDPAKVEMGDLSLAEVIETPRSNYLNNPSIRIDWLTGRARVIRPRTSYEQANGRYNMDYGDKGPTL